MATLMQNVIVCRTTNLQTKTSHYGRGKNNSELENKSVKKKKEE
jgi:hypothetical protein